MSNLRERAREIKARGVEERGNFEPQGKPREIYEYWLETSISDKARAIRNGRRRENFCHFWRVVLFWAPMLFLFDKSIQFAASRFGAIAIALLLVAATVTGAVYSVDFRFVLALILGVVAVVGAGLGLGYLFVHHVPERAQVVCLKGLFFAAIAAGVATFGFMLWAAVMDFGLITVLLWTVGIIVGLAVLVFGGIFLADFISGRRQIAKAESHQRIQSMTAEELAEATEPKEPGKVSKFFSGVGDFIVLLAQIVRVKKWKICPMVTIK